ncbi:hypothetical protein [Streptomyces rubiginosohelvolus]|uniref:hypothetical protein n=1 Tax=Streptomyces rubiginosohelvolus TaxID=67362 RepID=UPI0035D982BB
MYRAWRAGARAGGGPGADPEALEPGRVAAAPDPAAAPAEAVPSPEQAPGSVPAPPPHPTGQLAKAERLLLSLRHTRRDLLLGVREARALAVEAVKWLEGGLPEGDLRQALPADPPEGGVRSAVGLRTPCGRAPHPGPAHSRVTYSRATRATTGRWSLPVAGRVRMWPTAAERAMT